MTANCYREEGKNYVYIYIYFSDGRFCCFLFFRLFAVFVRFPSINTYTNKEQFVFGTHILCAKKFAKRERSNRKQNGMKRITNIYHFGVVFFHLDQLTKIYHCFLSRFSTKTETEAEFCTFLLFVWMQS